MILVLANPAKHQTDHSNVNHCLRIFGSGFVVADQPAVLDEPAEGSFDNPAFGQHLETTLVLKARDNFQAQRASLAMRCDPGGKGCAPIPLIGPDAAHPTETLE